MPDDLADSLDLPSIYRESDNVRRHRLNNPQRRRYLILCLTVEVWLAICFFFVIEGNCFMCACFVHFRDDELSQCGSFGATLLFIGAFIFSILAAECRRRAFWEARRERLRAEMEDTDPGLRPAPRSTYTEEEIRQMLMSDPRMFIRQPGPGIFPGRTETISWTAVYVDTTRYALSDGPGPRPAGGLGSRPEARSNATSGGRYDTRTEAQPESRSENRSAPKKKAKKKNPKNK